MSAMPSQSRFETEDGDLCREFDALDDGHDFA